MGKKKHPEHVNHERWLVSYADFITLLFAFFVVMFATSQSDKKKLATAAQAMQAAFNDSAIFQAHSEKPPLDDQSAIVPPAVTPSITPTGTEGTDAAQDSEAIHEELEQTLAREIAFNNVSIRQTESGLVISLHEAGFFPSGSADIRHEAIPTLQKIGEALSRTNNNIRIEGHTDNRPIHTAQFASNWELSSARATRIAHFFLDMPGMDASRYAAAGYAQYHPVADNSTEDGRMQNRRVDIVLLPANTPASAADAPSKNPTADAMVNIASAATPTSHPLPSR
jgi:chemotaxis protein MotB